MPVKTPSKRVYLKDFVVGLYRKNPKTTKESIIKQVKAKFPASKFGEKHVAPYASIARGLGIDIPYALATKSKGSTKSKPKAKAKNTKAPALKSGIKAKKPKTKTKTKTKNPKKVATKKSK